MPFFQQGLSVSVNVKRAINRQQFPAYLAPNLPTASTVYPGYIAARKSDGKTTNLHDIQRLRLIQGVFPAKTKTARINQANSSGTLPVLVMAGVGIECDGARWHALAQELERLSAGTVVDTIISYVDVSNGLAVKAGQKVADLPNGELRRMTAADAIQAASLAMVAHVSVNHVVTGMGTPAPPYDFMPQSIQPRTKPTLGLQVLGQGAGIGVAVIDSGITPDLNPDLYFGATVVHSESFVAGEDSRDYFGHGTHMRRSDRGDGPEFAFRLFERHLWCGAGRQTDQS